MIEQERRFARVAERYQETLSEQEPATLALLALLQRLCLFRLGVDAATLTSIFTGDDEQTRKIAGPDLAALTAEQLQQMLDRLTAMKLVEVSASQPTALAAGIGGKTNSKPTPDASAFGSQYSIHPAVRDGFLSGITDPDRTAGHEAARVGLSAALGDSPGENPSDPATLDLLEEIVHHTLQSGHVQEAWDVHQNRIGGARNLLWRLDAYDRGERLCRAFAGGQSAENLFGRRPSFTVAWGNAPGIEEPSHGLTEGHVHPGRDEDGLRPSDTSEHSSPGALPQATVIDGLRPHEAPFLDLPESEQAIFRNEWALYLGQLDRLEAAAHCYELNIEMRLREEYWQNASRGNQNLCDVRLLSGRLRRRNDRRRVAPAGRTRRRHGRTAELVRDSRPRPRAAGRGSGRPGRLPRSPRLPAQSRRRRQSALQPARHPANRPARPPGPPRKIAATDRSESGDLSARIQSRRC